MGLNHGSETVLVVDNEMMVMELARDFLQRFGYTVLMANNGERAMELYQRRSNEIVAVLLIWLCRGWTAEMFSTVSAQ